MKVTHMLAAAAIYSSALLAQDDALLKEAANAPRAIREGELANPGQPTAEEILKLVRISYALQDHQLTGRLEDYASGRQEPFVLNMTQQVIRFRFQQPAQIVNLDLSQEPAQLTNVQSGGKEEVRLSQYGERVRNFDLNYEDLSLRFLYWKQAQLLGEDSISGQKMWKLRVTSPDGRGPYGTVDIWVHQKSGGMAKMEGWDKQGKFIKRFEIISVQKAGETWVPKKMKIQTLDPNSSYKSPKTLGTTNMLFDKPEKTK
jgi:hypothetical protein